MEDGCPKCGEPNKRQARFCAKCGLDLAYLLREAPEIPRTAESPIRPAYGQGIALPAQANMGQVGPMSYPLPPTQPASKGSVVQALRPSRPASVSFWVGLVLLIAALVLGACPAGVALALALDPMADESTSSLGPALGVFGCFFLGLVVIGMALVALGRPRQA